jgi:CRP-like cAMP-binding protein
MMAESWVFFTLLGISFHAGDLLILLNVIQQLEQYISARVKLTDEEFSLVAAAFTEKKLRRRQFLLQAGEVCRHVAFVCSGALRLFSIDARGQEHVLQFALENWWISDRKSVIEESPSEFNIEAIEDSQLLVISKENLDRLQKDVPSFLYMMQGMQQNNFIATQMRLQASLSMTAEERYHDFISRYPDIWQRVPQHMIASYLGLSPETLSRVRAKSGKIH